MRRLLPLAALAALALPGQDLSRLPEWAREPARAAQAETAPADAQAWVLLQRHELAYTGGGEVKARNLRLVKVLAERGLREAFFSVRSLGGRASRIKSLKGWNLRPDGEVVRLEKEDVAWEDSDSGGGVSTSVRASAFLHRAVPGSLLAFECVTVERLPMGPEDGWVLPEDIPVRRWELAFARKGGLFSDLSDVASRLETRAWEPWGIRPEPLEGGGVAASRVRPLPEKEGAHPWLGDVLPSVSLRFLDPRDAKVPPGDSWDTLATWVHGRYREAWTPTGATGAAGLPPRDALAAIGRWMSRELVYKAVYLTPERGWVPLPASEVVRRRYGDCKDLATCFLAEASQAGFEPFPVLCRISQGSVPGDAPVSVYAFNHVIAAVRIKESLGLAAEIETPSGRFLLVDGTARYTPVGLLPAEHRGRRVMICTPSGAVWARIPETATQRPRLRIDLQGAVGSGGAVKAAVRVQETADAATLRMTAHLGGAGDLRKLLLATWFPIPPGGALTDLAFGDPMDLAKPFEVSFTLTHPSGWTGAGSSYGLVDWGLPGIPSAPQKPGIPRQLPLERWANRELQVRATWTLPGPLRPALPDLQADTPLRSLRWQARIEGDRLLLELDDHLKDATYGWDRRPEGVQAWRADRQLIQKLNEQGLRLRTE